MPAYEKHEPPPPLLLLLLLLLLVTATTMTKKMAMMTTAMVSTGPVESVARDGPTRACLTATSRLRWR